MSSDLGSSHFFKLVLALAAILVALTVEGPSRAGPPAESKAEGSVSEGTPMKGQLSRGEVLPKKGSGYSMRRATRERRARFGVSELVRLVQRAAHKVHRRHPGSLLAVGDLSTRKGGPLENHGSHQSGRDVDLGFYALDRAGKPVMPADYVPFDVNGYSVDPPLEYRFDAPRNWALVQAIIRSDEAEVQWIFVADHLKRLMIDYARAHKAPNKVVGRALQILKQPGKKAHWDHFHVRIYCPADDLPACEDVGPRWAWVR